MPHFFDGKVPEGIMNIRCGQESPSKQRGVADCHVSVAAIVVTPEGVNVQPQGVNISPTVSTCLPLADLGAN
jgi:hypothetical protein